MEEIERIGLKRAPNEACGLLLGARGKQTTVVELPNRSLTPFNGYVLDGQDMKLAVEAHGDIVEAAAAWHTHPQGLVGPSRRDMEHRPNEVPMLVVALTEEGAVPVWF